MVQIDALWNPFEVGEVLPPCQEELDRVKSLQVEMLVLLLFKDGDEELIPFLVYAVLATLLVLQELGEDGVGVAQGGLVDMEDLGLIGPFVLALLGIRDFLLHEGVESSEQVLFDQKFSVILVPSQIEVEAGNESDK